MTLEQRIREGLEGRAIVVTGGGSGIGRAVCLCLVGYGVRVAVVDLYSEGVSGTLEAIKGLDSSSEPLGLALDVRSEKDMEEMASQVYARFGAIDALVHSAGILRPRGGGPKPLVDISTAEWDAMIETNLKGTFLANRAVLPVMIKNLCGHIINISSVSGRKGRALDSAYCASKFGMVGLSESLAEEVRRYGIKVQVVMPDAVDTPLWDQNGPIRAPGSSLAPERVAMLICYALSLPSGAILDNLIIKPYVRRTRTRKKTGS